jgi:hypothetical protein
MIVVSRFATVDIATQKIVTFFMIPVQMAVADVQTVTPVLFNESF